MVASRSHIPHLRKTSNSAQLYVHNQPFLVRGAELQNSSFSSIQHMSTLWHKMKQMNVNVVLGSVSWELLEPTEGHFDFSLVDDLIAEARSHHLKLILLWFGTWKNGISNYVPAWVKLQPERFPRVEIRASDGSLQLTEILSAIHGDAVESDIKAFQALMTHLKAVDEHQSTVIMVQVENEVGVLGDSRDHSPAASAVFDAAVPDDLVDFLESDREVLHVDLRKKIDLLPKPLVRGKSWPMTFGDDIRTDELFMAYHYARYIEKVARAGKAIFPLPLFANFWLNYAEDPFASHYPVLAGGGAMPGDYPSGGAVSNVLDIWVQFAPTLSFISPDTYLNDYHRVCSTYRHRNQPLFIPEQRRDEYGARRIWAAIGHYLAIGACPFALDTLEASTCAYTQHYGLISKVEKYILAAQQTPGAIMGFFFDEIDHKEASSVPGPQIEMAGYRVTVERAFTTGKPGPGYGVVIHLHTNEEGISKYLLVGAGFQVKWKSLDKQSRYTGILRFEEQNVVPSTGELHAIRTLNGDETRSGQQAIMPNDVPDDGGFPINITIPAVTKIATCTVYSIR